MTLCALLMAAAVSAPRTLDDCDALVRDHPKEIRSYLCYWLTGRSLKALDDAARRLDARLALEPDDHLAELYLGLVEADRGRPRALSLFERAAAGLQAEGNATGEVYARISIAINHRSRGSRAEAGQALALARGAAERSGDPLLVARVDWEGSRQAYETSEYATAWALAARADAAVTQDAPLDLRSGVLAMLGGTSWALGRHRDAFEYFERQAVMLHDAGQLWAECQARSNMAILAGALLGEGEMTIHDVRRLTREAFDLTIAAANPWVECDVRLLLAQDKTLPFAEREEHLQTVLRRNTKPGRTGEALRLLAGLRLEDDPAHPEKALALIEQAEAVARAGGSPLEVALCAVARMNYRWKVGPEDQAIADTLAALDAVERIRDLQTDEMVRARWFSEQAVYYYRASGRFLESGDLDRAFAITERMRARALLDSLDAQHAVTPPDPAREPLETKRREVLASIADAQRKLLRDGGNASREELLREIDRLEMQDGVLRDEIARADPRAADLGRPSIPSLREVQSLLGEDEALLAFQLSTGRVDDSVPVAGGGSWLLAVTHGGVKAFPLPDADVLRKSIDVYLGTFARRDGLDRLASVRLYEEILGDALSSLPATVKRLIVVPDRDLHRLPFHALAKAADATPLAAAFDIVIAPSATIWARSRREPRQLDGRRVLAFADPELSSASEPATLRQAAPWIEGLRLGPLPNARAEAHRLSRLLGPACIALEGAAATESGLKRAPLRQVGVLVLATHAVVDEERPERSAVLLAPGAAAEDGLLQPREIAALPLDGPLVVLSSCSSATGQLLRGEGVLGVAHAFFQAGARAVVASLWPMRDDEAAALAGSLYRHLSEGASVDRALAAARRDRIAAGAPAAEWAGMVLVGDGDLVPFPGGVRSASFPWRGAIAFLVLVVTGIGLVHRTRTRTA